MEKAVYTSICTSCGLTASGFFSTCMKCGCRRMNQLRHEKNTRLPSELTLAQNRGSESLIGLALIGVLVVAFLAWYCHATGQQGAVWLSVQRLRINIVAAGQQVSGLQDNALTKKIAHAMSRPN